MRKNRPTLRAISWAISVCDWLSSRSRSGGLVTGGLYLKYLLPFWRNDRGIGDTHDKGGSLWAIHPSGTFLLRMLPSQPK